MQPPSPSSVDQVSSALSGEDTTMNGGESTRRSRGSVAVQHQPTRVLYVRNLPLAYTEHDLMALCSAFGNVTQILLLKEKRHGFVEFDDYNHAAACHNYYKTRPVTVLGSQIDFTWSGRTEITRKRNPDDNPPNRILLVTVNNVLYPVTVDVLNQIFAKFGPVEKIIIFSRGTGVQAFVQMSDTSSALMARQHLDGQNIYAGCNSLKVQFSSLQELEVKQNNEKSFDFQNSHDVMLGPPPLLHPSPTSSQRLSPMAAYGGSASPHRGFSPASMSAPPGGPTSSFGGFWMAPQGSMSPQAGPQGSGDMTTLSLGGRAPVCIVKNLEDNVTKPEELASLFSVYGNVVRVKIMYKLRSTALVQLGDVIQCNNARSNLNGVVLHSRQIQVELSKGGPIPPAHGVSREDSLLTRDFNEPNYHRHKPDKPLKMFPPSNTLHLSNLPDDTPDESVAQLCGSVANPQQIRFLNPERHMALVQFVDTTEAVEVLVACHNMLVGNRHVRMAFGASRRPEVCDILTATTTY